MFCSYVLTYVSLYIYNENMSQVTCLGGSGDRRF